MPQEPAFLAKTEKAITKINHVFTFAAGMFILAMVLIITYDVIMRNFFDSPSLWALDLARFSLVYIFFLALAPALQSGQHVSTDIFLAKFSLRTQWYLKLVALMITAIYGVILFWQVTETTLKVFEDNRIFPVAIELPMKYVYMVAPVGALQFIVTAMFCLAVVFFREAPLRQVQKEAIPPKRVINQ
ncbi:TRAP transporter small permease [Mesobacillus selenatarsenatis]|uniref:Tripartite transporter, small subunit n=1 Tax=Mesobacillus selenatarsenatis (strain DSM 18680 / JCM 14380 / FERM P-15431 / SF-1) TaxID=1321606 RepID=A0A0A8X7Q2_MESS1|nr:TRAP transporter small permease [Mesobacillus selenatarsenatis]GAM15918.1 tripartite transporter, small subunit [Mesobacillus selenatarsenatis SF-1]